LYILTYTNVQHDFHIMMFVSFNSWHEGCMDQELLALPKHLISPSGFSGVRVAQSSVFCRSLFETVKCMFQNRFIGVFSSNLIISWGQFYWCRE